MRNDSKFYRLGEEGRNKILELREQGVSIYKITNYLNKNYKHVLNCDESFNPSITYSYFRNWGNKELANRKQIKLDALKKTLKTDKLDELLDTLYGWLDEYKTNGNKLNLRDTINSVIKIHELLEKLKQESRNSEQTNTVKTFLDKVQKEFSAPTITKEVEFDENGKPTKAKVTTRLKEEPEQEFDEFETEAVEIN